MRIAIDVMGGDHAPGAILDGAFAALKSLDPGDELLLVGKEAVIRQAIAAAAITDPRLRVVDAPDEIGMDEQPVEAVRSKPRSSIVVMSELAHRRAEDSADVIISAGNTGACVTAAQMSLRRLPGVHRPGIAVILPTFGGPVVLCDVGANPDPRASHLAQYGLMGEVYAREVLGIASPRVAMMNIGGEEGKGTGIIKATRDLLRATPDLNYVGYVEGRSLFDHAADVVVTDGFVGNVVIKLAEGLASGLFRTIAREIAAIDPNLVERFKPVQKRIYALHDYHEHGGAPLLGVNGICIICHGSSEARTITNAILKSRNMVSQGVNQALVKRIAEADTKVGVG
ncbi:MAG: phosphate acyltransferase PlsX [Phycisphaerales bacterium]|nr:phosphate acyltransferase PlsX [Phycisphaerales bacterium]